MTLVRGPRRMSGHRKSALADLRIVMSISGKPDIDAVALRGSAHWAPRSSNCFSRAAHHRVTDHITLKSAHYPKISSLRPKAQRFNALPSPPELPATRAPASPAFRYE